MYNDEKSVVVNIAGIDYPIKGEFDAEYIKKIAQNLDLRIREMEQHFSSKSGEKVAILTALNLEDELFISEQKRQAILQELHRRMNKIINRLDKVLKETY
jgi:cell division protein ZapA (FtsZ GTPase activity inhibitor)